MKSNFQSHSAAPLWRGALALLAFLCLNTFAASASATDAAGQAHPQDPFEGFNRAMFQVHEGLDKVALRPLAQGYETAVPLPARMSVHNFYESIWDLSRGGNAFLQGKGQEGFTSLGRLLINSTVGIFGLFDVATELGLEQGDEDFGQTFAAWGVPPGPYLFLPIIGPNTSRDLVGWGVDQYFYPLWWHVDDVPVRNSTIALRAVELRASLLPSDRIIDEAALDRYSYIRSAYLQRRASQVHDGQAPRVNFDD